MSDKIHICSTLSPFEEDAKAIGFIEKYWEPSSTLHIHFLKGEEQWKRRVASIALEWTQYANLDFCFHFDPTQPPVDKMGNNIADIVIDFWDNGYGGGWSYYGTDSREYARIGQASMMLPTWDAEGTILHEFGHALGLVHEHKNPGAGIQWNKEQVYADMKQSDGWPREKVDHNVFGQVSDDLTQYTQFDLHSIMIYEVPQHWTLNNFSTRRTGGLSSADKAFIAQVYPVTQGMRATEVIGYSDWNGWIAVEGDTIYRASQGNLYRGKIAADTVVNKIGTGGWDGPIAVSDGQIYLVSNGNLWSGRADADNVVTSIIGQGGWHGAIAVSGNQIYMTVNGNLMRGKITANNAYLDETIGHGGWNGPIAIWKNDIYLVSQDNLMRGTIANNVVTNTVGSGGWNGQIAIDTGMIYYVDGDLARGAIR